MRRICFAAWFVRVHVYSQPLWTVVGSGMSSRWDLRGEPVHFAFFTSWEASKPVCVD